MGKSSSMAVAEKISWYCAVFAAMMLLMNSFQVAEEGSTEIVEQQQPSMMITGYSDRRPACDEIYEVKEGETLQTISEKCGDPYIVEGNPHIHDHDDLFPGLLIRITPSF
ncbi:unnamed protein product [Arabidopsis lyrata]|uniref:Peptidoglycan-binding LysM domain-containing protein n=3 Tax=Arabidopsis TaxID=3701 RepID=D7LUB2_ARALL|nr:uncharacterized protein LOC9313955 [Arabidopsis lyrata subsp. lyrata]EFH54146.1 peptidoglycan-binding LysM domain-containing protein [Arabidopsis lyrata subsp. lyrata]KAG7565454.1 LysM domain [Arabidopsis suecica]CAE6076027.1 unnamed protein product [Arabidopsis arenosa]CAH8268413.1 unnamed protein product [Arabidopsis lyrata]|eukprot:XP_002877887.1 uncharacterized protein LOC9313955 [Arabidopsis lyrata subsp. lyrata]